MSELRNMTVHLGRFNERCRRRCPDRAGYCRTNYLIYVALSLTLSFIVVSPALWCGLFGDDIINALTPEWVQNTYGSLYRLIFDTASSWAAIGRLYPISIAVSYTVWNYTYYDPAYAQGYQSYRLPCLPWHHGRFHTTLYHFSSCRSLFYPYYSALRAV